jgi:hypothetical protein
LSLCRKEEEISTLGGAELFGKLREKVGTIARLLLSLLLLGPPLLFACLYGSPPLLSSILFSNSKLTDCSVFRGPQCRDEEEENEYYYTDRNFLPTGFVGNCIRPAYRSDTSYVSFK